MEGLSADAKGPMATPTPEGYNYYFAILCVYSAYVWILLAKATSEWKIIWPKFVSECEAREGREKCISYLITDNHKVHVQGSISKHNMQKGIREDFSSPYDQWQEPTERVFGTLNQAATVSSIQGGTKPWMWGWAIKHAAKSFNMLNPPKRVSEAHGKMSKTQIHYRGSNRRKELRHQKPYLSLCFRTMSSTERGSKNQLTAKAEPCCFLLYEANKKAFAAFSLPNLYLRSSLEFRLAPLAFPLRTMDYLNNQIHRCISDASIDDPFNPVHGPSNIMQHQKQFRPRFMIENKAIQVQDKEQPHLEEEHEERQPAQRHPAGPIFSSSRGFKPSLIGLESACNAATFETAYTPDELAARTPRSTHQALSGPDAEFWKPAIVRDFNMLRSRNCLINITSDKPPGSNPPPLEQRFKVKYRAEQPATMKQLMEKELLKARTIARGDRFRQGEHYDATAAPVVHTPSLKIMIVWAVRNNLQLFKFDEVAAFYGNQMDRTGVYVKLEAGYNPVGEDLRPLSSTLR